MSKKYLLGFVAAAICCTARAESLNPYIVNPGFEQANSFDGPCAGGTPDPCFNSSFVGWSGVNGTINPTGIVGGNLNAYEGKNAAWINNLSTFAGVGTVLTGVGGSVTVGNNRQYFGQTLTGISLQPSTSYTFSYAVSRRADSPASNPGTFSLQVNANGATGSGDYGEKIWILQGNTASITPGQWQIYTLSFTTTATTPTGNPSVFLVNEGSNTGGVSQIEFDAAPEPAALALTGLGFAILAFRRHRARTMTQV